MHEIDDITQRLLRAHGELIGGEALMRCLGYRTARAYQMAVRNGHVPVQTFELRGRRGRFARTVDVAYWLNSLGQDKQGAAE